jgi:membrane protein DedA with SNARE-associated domain
MEQLLLHYGYLLVLVGTIVEGDATLLTAAFLAHRGYLHLWLVLVIAASASTVANQVYYWTARRYALQIFERGLASNERAQRAKTWVTRRGGVLLLFSRFILGFRIAIPAACGAVHMPAPKFFWLNSAGAVLWVLTIGLGGYAGGHAAQILYRDIRRHEWLIAGFLLITVFLYVAWQSRGRELRDLGAVIRHPEQLATQAIEQVSGPSAGQKWFFSFLPLDTPEGRHK